MEGVNDGRDVDRLMTGGGDGDREDDDDDADVDTDDERRRRRVFDRRGLECGEQSSPIVADFL